MIELRDVLNIHNILIDKFGGSKGVRDKGSLESAISRPFILLDNGLDIVADQEEKYQLVISASQGDIRFDDVKTWIQARLKKKNEA